VNLNKVYERTLSTQIAEAGSRFGRVMGRVPKADVISKFLRGTPGVIGKFAKGLGTVLGPAIDIFRIGSDQPSSHLNRAKKITNKIVIFPVGLYIGCGSMKTCLRL
jgi:hypothetical protein